MFIVFNDNGCVRLGMACLSGLLKRTVSGPAYQGLLIADRDVHRAIGSLHANLSHFKNVQA